MLVAITRQYYLFKFYHLELVPPSYFVPAQPNPSVGPSQPGRYAAAYR
jgi:hypothetical protein